MNKPEFCEFDLDLVRPRLRSVRVNGLSTCFRLEEVYWKIIEQIARKESLTVGKLISKWALEIDLKYGSVWNFTGFLRVVCVMQLIDRKYLIDLPDRAAVASLTQNSLLPINGN